ncbi:MAG: hypothetical protein ACPIOQ_32160 [Promethearchaeia archaeon]
MTGGSISASEILGFFFSPNEEERGSGEIVSQRAGRRVSPEWGDHSQDGRHQV